MTEDLHMTIAHDDACWLEEYFADRYGYARDADGSIIADAIADEMAMERWIATDEDGIEHPWERIVIHVTPTQRQLIESALANGAPV